MAVLADLIQRPTLTAQDLAKEKPVIAQEIAEAADTPDDLVFELAQAQAFAGQPLGRPILGTRKSVGAASAARLADYRASLYAPDAIVISAAGAVDEDELLALAERMFSGPAQAAAPSQPAPASFVGGQARAARALEQAHLVLLLPAPGLRDPDYFALRLFAEILGGGMSSRLFQEVREHRGLAYAIDAYADCYADAGVLGVYAGCAAENAADTARLAAEQIAALVEGADAAELARAKAQLKAAYATIREDEVWLIGLYIQTDTNVEGNIDRIRNSWKNRQGGVENAHQVRVRQRRNRPPVCELRLGQRRVGRQDLDRGPEKILRLVFGEKYHAVV